jgi:hypothetical protein
LQTSAATGQSPRVGSEAELFALVRAVGRRIRLKDTLRLAPRALALTLAGALLGLLVEPRMGGAGLVFLLALGLAGGAALMVRQGRRRLGMMAAAIQMDRGLGLSERVSTAVHLVRAGTGGTLVERQLEDARWHGAAADAGAAYRLVIPRADLALVAGLGLLLAGLLATPVGGDLRAAIGRSAVPAVAIGEGALAEGTGDLEATLAKSTSPEVADDLAELQRALEQLRLSANPEALAQRDALAELGRDLRTSSVSRDFGRELENDDLAAAGAALRELVADLPDMNAGERAELQRDLELATQALADDPILGPHFQQAAEALGNSRESLAAANLDAAANSVGQLAPVLAAEDDLQQRIAGLEQEIGDLGRAVAPDSGLAGESIPTTEINPGTGQSDGSTPGLESDARGRESDDLEALGADERLDAAGNLEIVEIEADEDATVENFAPPTVQTSGDPEPSLEPSAGDYGYVVSQPDVATEVPIDSGSIVADYFSPEQ